MKAISVEALEVTFHRRGNSFAALRSVDFSVEEGETFGLIGPSGCGKSTILRVLAGLQREWEGRVVLLGQEIAPQKRFVGRIRREVQMVFQDPYASLHPRHRIYRALAEPLQVAGESYIESKIAEVLAQVGFSPDIAKRYPHQLSGGQRQRIAIARALLLKPKLLLLDEPTSALDMSVQAEILNLLNDVKAAHGMTLVLVSHDPDVVAHMCDRAVTMHQGAIVSLVGRGARGWEPVAHPTVG